MSLIQNALETGLLPDSLIRYGIRRLNRRRLVEESRGGEEAVQARLASWLERMRSGPIAVQTEAANAQHYEVPTEFYRKVLGPRLKYSCCYFEPGVASLAQAEEAMLELYVDRGRLADGQEILELGCGWGSLSLYLAERFPRCRILAVSNSRTQKAFLDSEIARRRLGNLEIQTADMNDFQTERRFDRVVSIEMFEHMRNWERLTAKVADWLRAEGKFFLHIFTHSRFAYPFEDLGSDDWMARYFFSGGMMPSDDLPLNFQRELKLVERWRVDGVHYRKTAECWLQNLDRSRLELLPLLGKTYGEKNAMKWFRYWRVFFMSCSELWGFREGREWLVSHYLFEKPDPQGR